MWVCVYRMCVCVFVRCIVCGLDMFLHTYMYKNISKCYFLSLIENILPLGAGKCAVHFLCRWQHVVVQHKVAQKETWKEILHLSAHLLLKSSALLVILHIKILHFAVSGRKNTVTKKELRSDIFPSCFRNFSVQNTSKLALIFFSFFLSFIVSWAVQSVRTITNVFKTTTTKTLTQTRSWLLNYWLKI